MTGYEPKSMICDGSLVVISDSNSFLVDQTPVEVIAILDAAESPTHRVELTRNGVYVYVQPCLVGAITPTFRAAES